MVRSSKKAQAGRTISYLMPAVKNYPIKTVGEDAFYSNYIGPIITLFQNLKKSPKIQK